MPGVSVEIEGEEGLLDMIGVLLGLEMRSTNYQLLLETKMTDEAHDFFKDQFATAGQAGGDPWLPLTPYTERLKTRLGYGAKGILRRTDELYNSLTQRGANLGRAEADMESLELGTEDPKAMLHQEGYSKLPPRVIVPDEIPDAYTDKWDSLVLDYVEGSDE